MSGFAGQASGVCRVLDVDPDLAITIPVERREQAMRECVARTLSVPVGPWQALQAPHESDGIGLLLLDGLLIRRVDVDGKFGAELLGVGDLLRPWHGEDDPLLLPVRVGWQAIRRSRMAVLDGSFARLLGRYPQLSGHLVARAVQRSRNLAVNMAIVHQSRVDTRLHLLLWHLAARWGHVRSDGVKLPLRLTHNVLADLAAARRPTVTSALAELAEQGLVHQMTDGWLLSGDPPHALIELGVMAPTDRQRVPRSSSSTR
jgi:CRP/FNR family transcriptional regulator, cyclic AMP receptor protein